MRSNEIYTVIAHQFCLPSLNDVGSLSNVTSAIYLYVLLGRLPIRSRNKTTIYFLDEPDMITKNKCHSSCNCEVQRQCGGRMALGGP